MVETESHGMRDLKKNIQQLRLQTVQETPLTLGFETPGDWGYLDRKNIPKTPNLRRYLEDWNFIKLGSPLAVCKRFWAYEPTQEVK